MAIKNRMCFVYHLWSSPVPLFGKCRSNPPESGYQWSSHSTVLLCTRGDHPGTKGHTLQQWAPSAQTCAETAPLLLSLLFISSMISYHLHIPQSWDRRHYNSFFRGSKTVDQSDQVTCPRSHSTDEGTKVFSSIINCCLTRLTETLPLEKQRKTTYNPRHQVQSRGRRCAFKEESWRDRDGRTEGWALDSAGNLTFIHSFIKDLLSPTVCQTLF